MRDATSPRSPVHGAASRSFADRARLLLFVLTLAAYAAGLSGAFQFDDHGVIVRYEGVHSLGGLLAGLGGLRPILKLSYALCWAFGGDSLLPIPAPG